MNAAHAGNAGGGDSRCEPNVRTIGVTNSGISEFRLAGASGGVDDEGMVTDV